METISLDVYMSLLLSKAGLEWASDYDIATWQIPLYKQFFV